MMIKLRNTVFLLISILFVSSFLVIFEANCSSVQNQEKSLNYIKDVLPINSVDYTVVLIKDQEINGTTGTFEQMLYSLNSSENELAVNCLLREGVPCSLDMRVNPNSAIVNNLKTDIFTVSKAILTAHTRQTKINSTNLLSLLDMASLQTNQTIWTSEGIALSLTHERIPAGLEMVNGEIHVNSTTTIDVTSLRWKQTEDPSAIPLFSITFQNGLFYSLYDQRTGTDLNQTGIQGGPIPITPLTTLLAVIGVAVVSTLIVAIVLVKKKYLKSKKEI